MFASWHSTETYDPADAVDANREDATMKEFGPLAATVSKFAVLNHRSEDAVFNLSDLETSLP
jgi:hypothetical protein